MLIRGRNGSEINSISTWEVHGAPAGADRHWQPGRSAFELAVAWTSGGAEHRVVDLLSQVPELSDIELVEGTAEKKTSFDDIPQGPRNHDLLIEARTGDGRVVIGVEGKADEPFDKSLGDWLAVERSDNSRAHERLTALTKSFFGVTVEDDGEEPRLATIGYQLVSALAGTMADAARDESSGSEQAERAVLLVQEFITTETEDEKHGRNARVLDDFVDRLSRGEASRIENGESWITSAIEVDGAGDRMPARLPIHVAKLVERQRPADNL